ncbi:aminopeptidase P family N-terminal domain-containing protein [Eubacteriales bacterium OttesenSCG-928-N14]|nr:aminopeptidase P family N-terminal domain-containing protein [Eubacteriales bacterium OttesenSCG-928-N14]
MINRINKLRPALYRSVIDALYVHSNSEDTMRYFSNYHAPNTMLLIGRNRCFLITDAVHKEEAEQAAPDFEVYVADENRSPIEIIIEEALPSQSIKRLGYEPEFTPEAFVADAKAALRPHGIGLVNCASTVERLKKTVE